MGASETTGSTLLATMIAAAVVPRVMDELRAEQAEVIAKHGAELSYEALQQYMPYLDATVRESTRVLPAVHIVFRRATEDIEVGDYTLKKGALCLCMFDLLHAVDESLWDKDMSGEVPLHVDPMRLAESCKPERQVW